MKDGNLGKKPVRNDAGELCLNDRAKQTAWKEHSKCLSNTEFNWDPDSLTEVHPTLHVPLSDQGDQAYEVWQGCRYSMIIAEMLKASGDEETQQSWGAFQQHLWALKSKSS